MLSLMLLAAAPATQQDAVAAALKIAQSNFIRSQEDRFAAQTDVPLQEGQKVVVRFKFQSGDRMGPDGGGSTVWTYEDGVIRLYFTPSTTPIEIAGKRSGIPVVYYSVAHQRVGAYTGQNAFGVRSPVTQHITSEFGLAIVDRPKGELSPYAEQENIDFLKRMGQTDEQLAVHYNTFIVSLNRSGPEARRLSSNAYAEIEGVISPIQGRLTGCGSRFSGATVNHPWELTTYSCWAGANIGRVTFFDGDGKILKEWRK